MGVVHEVQKVYRYLGYARDYIDIMKDVEPYREGEDSYGIYQDTAYAIKELYLVIINATSGMDDRMVLGNETALRQIYDEAVQLMEEEFSITEDEVKELISTSELPGLLDPGILLKMTDLSLERRN